MGLDNDTHKIFEAYRLLNEAPVDPGASFEDPDVVSKFNPEDIERLTKYKMPDAGTIFNVVIGIRDMLTSHENRHYPGTYIEFRDEIVKVIQDKAKIGLANAKYAARVIQNELKRLDVIKVDSETKAVEIEDVSSKKEEINAIVEPAIRDAAEGKTEKQTELKFRVKYEIDPNVTIEDEDLNTARQELSDTSNLGETPTGKEVMAALNPRYGFKDAKKFSDALVSIGYLIPIEKSESDIEKYGYAKPDAEGEEREKQEEIEGHVSRSEWGDKKPQYGIDRGEE